MHRLTPWAPIAALALLLVACGDGKTTDHDSGPDPDGGADVDGGGPDIDGGGPDDEICDNEVDDDGDEDVDCNDSDCDEDPACEPTQVVGGSCAEAVIAADPSTQEGTLDGHANVSDGACQTEVGGGGGFDYVYSVTPAIDGVLRLSLTADADLGIFVQSTCGDAGSELGCADAFGGGGQEELSVPVSAGVPVFVFVGGYTGANAGPFTLTIASEVVEPETICDNFVDEDEDGLVDCADPTACQTLPVCEPGDGATGTACTAHTDCAATGDDPFCLVEQTYGAPGGYCSQWCTLGGDDCGGDGVCADIGQSVGICYDGCTVGGDDCAAGYQCLDELGGVCIPACTDDAQCTTTGHCGPDGTCVVGETCDNEIDDNENGAIDCEDATCSDVEPCATQVANVCAAATVAVIGDNAGDTLGGSAVFSGTCTGAAGMLEELYAFTPGQPGETGTLTLTLSSATDQGLYIRTTCGDGATELSCTDAFNGGTDEVLTQPVEGGVPLTIVVDGYSFGGQAGPYVLNVAYTADPPL
jgi:hypothetical protein